MATPRRQPPNRLRPALIDTVHPDTRRAVKAWVAAAPPGEKRSVGRWIDLALKAMEGIEAGRLAREHTLRHGVRGHLQAILHWVGVLALGCDAPTRREAFDAIRAAVRAIDGLLPVKPS